MMTLQHGNKANASVPHVQIVTNENSSAIVNILPADDAENVASLATTMTGRQLQWTPTKLIQVV